MTYIRNLNLKPAASWSLKLSKITNRNYLKNVMGQLWIKKGFVSISSAIEVLSPCPGYTIVSAGRENSLFFMLFISVS